MLQIVQFLTADEARTCLANLGYRPLSPAAEERGWVGWLGQTPVQQAAALARSNASQGLRLGRAYLAVQWHVITAERRAQERGKCFEAAADRAESAVVRAAIKAAPRLTMLAERWEELSAAAAAIVAARRAQVDAVRATADNAADEYRRAEVAWVDALERRDTMEWSADAAVAAQEAVRATYVAQEVARAGWEAATAALTDARVALEAWLPIQPEVRALALDMVGVEAIFLDRDAGLTAPVV